MPTWHQITCITRAAAAAVHGQVTHLGGTNARGKPWRLSLGDAINGMLSGKWGFFLVTDDQRHDLILATDPSGARYVKTRKDPDTPATLLALPECSS